MKKNTVVKVLSLKFVVAGMLVLFVATPLAAAGPQEEARITAGQWLALVDAGKSVESRQRAAGYFKATISQDEWQCSLNAVRQTLGNPVSRKLKSVTFARSLPGLPEGEYMVVQFSTSFTNRKVAVESVTPRLDKDGKWRVCGYYIHLCAYN